MKVDIINPQVNRFVFPFAHDMIVLVSDRLQFLNLGCAPGHPSFEMSCSFTVQVPAQLDLLRNVTSIKSYMNDFQLLLEKLVEKVSTLHLPSLGSGLTVFTQEHAVSIGSKVGDTFKGEHFRY